MPRFSNSWRVPIANLTQRNRQDELNPPCSPCLRGSREIPSCGWPDRERPQPDRGDGGDLEPGDRLHPGEPGVPARLRRAPRETIEGHGEPPLQAYLAGASGRAERRWILVRGPPTAPSRCPALEVCVPGPEGLSHTPDRALNSVRP